MSQDLQYLKEEWHENIDDPSLRRSSTVLRRLLVQGELQRAWRAAGFTGQPKISASTLEPILSNIPREKIIFATAGGARHKGTELRGAFMTNYLMTDAEIDANRQEGIPSETVSLINFIDAVCIVVSGMHVSRRKLIQYIANKLGGAHYDPKRSPNEQLFSLLDSASHFQLLDKPLVYFELLSIGQAIAASSDIHKFLKFVKRSG